MNEDTNQAVDQMASQIADSSSPAGAAPTYGLGSNPTDDSTNTQGDDNNQPNPTFTPMDDGVKANSNEESSIARDDDNKKSSTPSATNDLGELGEIKKEALSKLEPIVDKLDQTPEERYRTLMLLIQSTDNQSFIKAAYQAASEIEDESKKAEALLGIVNEIEYFSQSNLEK